MVRLVTNRFLFGLLALSLFAANVAADEIGSSFIAGLIDAELVFEGEVIGVNYKLSTPTAADPATIQHTFVTYRINRVYKGAVASDARTDTADEITLRFLGGEGTNDEYLMASGVPLFDVGDHDVLMVAGNGDSICPLTHCEHGRYRIIDGYVYSEDGQEIVETADAPVVYGKIHELRDIMTHQMGAAELQLVGVHEYDETGLPTVQADYGIHYDTASFQAIVTDTLTTLEQAGLLPAQPPVPSIDPAADFIVLSPAAVTPGREPYGKLRMALQENSRGIDRLEELLVRFNGGDPRLPRWAMTLIQRSQTRALMRRSARESR